MRSASTSEVMVNARGGEEVCRCDVDLAGMSRKKGGWEEASTKREQHKASTGARCADTQKGDGRAEAAERGSSALPCFSSSDTKSLLLPSSSWFYGRGCTRTQQKSSQLRVLPR